MYFCTWIHLTIIFTELHDNAIEHVYQYRANVQNKQNCKSWMDHWHSDEILCKRLTWCLDRPQGHHPVTDSEPLVYLHSKEDQLNVIFWVNLFKKGIGFPHGNSDLQEYHHKSDPKKAERKICSICTHFKVERLHQ